MEVRRYPRIFASQYVGMGCTSAMKSAMMGTYLVVMVAMKAAWLSHCTPATPSAPTPAAMGFRTPLNNATMGTLKTMMGAPVCAGWKTTGNVGRKMGRPRPSASSAPSVVPHAKRPA